MRLVVRVLGAEVFAVEWSTPTSSPEEPSPAVGEPGLTEDGAPKVHETHLGASTQIGFVAGEPGWLP